MLQLKQQNHETKTSSLVALMPQFSFCFFPLMRRISKKHNWIYQIYYAQGILVNCYWVVKCASLPHTWNAHILLSDCKPVTFYLSHYALEHGYQYLDQYICYNMLHSKIHRLSVILDILVLYPLHYSNDLNLSCNKYFWI